MIPWFFLLCVVVLTLGTALFVAAEFSFVALQRPMVQKAVDAGDNRAKTVLVSLKNLSTQLSAAQVGITITTLLVGYLVQPSLGELLNQAAVLLGISGAWVGSASTILALILATVLSMLVGELVPQYLAISLPLMTGRIVAGPVQLFAKITKWLIVGLNGSANVILRWLRIEPQEELSEARTPQELALIAQRSAEAGAIGSGTAILLSRSLNFSARNAEDVMTPRVRIDSISRKESAADLLALAARTGHSRFPVLRDDEDHVEGIVHVKRAMAVPRERREQVPVSAIMETADFVPETMGLHPLMTILRSRGLQMAIVVDEYSGTAGIVSLEDVVEEIVGEVIDEHDIDRADMVSLGVDCWSVPGLWRPDEVTERTGAPVPDNSAYETLGGFVMAHIGRIPVAGDSVRSQGWNFTVGSMDGRRVESVIISRSASASLAPLSVPSAPAANSLPSESQIDPDPLAGDQS